MLPIVDYGGVAIVIPKVTAVGSAVEENDRYGFEVYLTGMDVPIVIGFDSQEDASEARDELIAIIAQYYFITEQGGDVSEGLLDDSDPYDKDKH